MLWRGGLGPFSVVSRILEEKRVLDVFCQWCLILMIHRKRSEYILGDDQMYLGVYLPPLERMEGD